MFRMYYDYSQRHFLLPKGGKDLIDVWKLEARKQAVQQRSPNQRLPYHQAPKPPAPFQPIFCDLVIPEHTTVLQLAALLRLKPYVVIADLMGLGLFTDINSKPDFATIAKVTRKHGYTARKES